MTRKDIVLDRYEARVEKGVVKYYAIDKKGNEYLMPEAFKEMYTNDYLEIRLTSSEMPQVFDLPENKEYWIPIRTAPLVKAKS